jgi:hypothetical protein
MQQSPSWEAKTSYATQEIPRTLWNPTVHHRIHKSQINPVYVSSPPPQSNQKVIKNVWNESCTEYMNMCPFCRNIDLQSNLTGDWVQSLYFRS